MSHRVISRGWKPKKKPPVEKAYTGEIYQPQRSHKLDDDFKMISDSDCLCLVMCEGEDEPDYQCTECKGTGKRRFFSLYEQTLMSVGRKHCYEGYDSNLDEFSSGRVESGDIDSYAPRMFSTYSN